MCSLLAKALITFFVFTIITSSFLSSNITSDFLYLNEKEGFDQLSLILGVYSEKETPTNNHKMVDVLCYGKHMVNNRNKKNVKYIFGTDDYIKPSIINGDLSVYDRLFKKHTWTYFGCLNHRLNLILFIISKICDVSLHSLQLKQTAPFGLDADLISVYSDLYDRLKEKKKYESREFTYKNREIFELLTKNKIYELILNGNAKIINKIINEYNGLELNQTNPLSNHTFSILKIDLKNDTFVNGNIFDLDDIGMLNILNLINSDELIKEFWSLFYVSYPNDEKEQLVHKHRIGKLTIHNYFQYVSMVRPNLLLDNLVVKLEHVIVKIHCHVIFYIAKYTGLLESNFVDYFIEKIEKKYKTAVTLNMFQEMIAWIPFMNKIDYSKFVFIVNQTNLTIPKYYFHNISQNDMYQDYYDTWETIDYPTTVTNIHGNNVEVKNYDHYVSIKALKLHKYFWDMYIMIIILISDKLSDKILILLLYFVYIYVSIH